MKREERDGHSGGCMRYKIQLLRIRFSVVANVSIMRVADITECQMTHVTCSVIHFYARDYLIFLISHDMLVIRT